MNGYLIFPITPVNLIYIIKKVKMSHEYAMTELLSFQKEIQMRLI